MAALNQVNLIGNLTRDPEVKYLQSGMAVCEIGIAVTEKVKKGEEWVEETLFADVTVWGRLAEVCGEYLSKGASVYFGGKLKLDQWEKDGKRFSKLKVSADKMQMLGGRPRNEDSQERPERREEHNQSPPAAPAEIPF